MKRFAYCAAVIVCGLSLYGCSDDGDLVISGGTQPSSVGQNAETDDSDANNSNPEKPDNSGEHSSQPGNDNPPSDGGSSDGNEQTEKPCDCPEGNTCLDGQCVPNCEPGTELCGTECLDFNLLHLESCEACSAGYCDTDANLANGCEASVLDDVNNCGTCGNVCNEGETCAEGACAPICQESELYCNGNCLNAADLHLSSCDACAENYCDTDSNLVNGCEAYTLADDFNNCGACGQACGEGESCIAGSCHKPYRVMLMKDGIIYSEASASGGGMGSKYDYVYVFEEVDGWYHITFNGNEGWVAKADTLYACDECPSRKAIDMAERLLYNSETYMCTFDHYKANTVPEFSEKFVSLASHSSCNYGYDLNCANFVTAILRANDLINASGYTFVSQLYDHCTAGKDGYHVIDKSQAKPGDFWVTSELGHAELVIGYYGGKLLLIGSNNFSASTSMSNLCQETSLTNNMYSSKANDYQRVSYGNDYTSGYVCSRQ